MESEIFFTNFTYNPDAYYFLYIGELKSYGLNTFLCEMFARQMDRPVECVSVIPDIFNQYNYRNLIVFSPKDERSTRTFPTSYRQEPHRFMAMVSESPHIDNLITQILAHQDHLFINMFESMPEMTLDKREGVSILGPDKNLANSFNNKLFQYSIMEEIVPVVDFKICHTRQQLLEVTEQLWDSWLDGIFISRMYSAAGSGSAITYSDNDIIDHFGYADSGYLVTRYTPHEFDPTVLGVVANEEEVYVAGVADQMIEDGNRFVGSCFPSKLPRDILEQLTEMTRLVGREMGRHGYRGIFGCDYLVDRDNQVRFLEVNARKQGTTLEFCYTLEQALPEGAATLPELEYYAVTHNHFPENTFEPEVGTAPVHWGTFNYKVREKKITRFYIPQNAYEREAFAKVASGELYKDFVILDHIGSGQVVMPGTFLARTVSIADNAEDVQEGLHQAKEMIKLTFRYM